MGSKPCNLFFCIEKELVDPIVYWPLRIALIFPIYQITLPITGFLFGQFKFFWNFEKKFLSRIGLGFLFKKVRNSWFSILVFCLFCGKSYHPLS